MISRAYSAAGPKSRLPPPRFRGAILATTTFRSKSFSVVFVTLICIKSVMSGVRCQLSIRAFPDMRLSAGSPRLALQSPSSNPATWLQSAVWSIPTVTATLPGWSGAVLPAHDLDLQLSRHAPWRRYIWWLFRQHCSQRALCPTRSFQPQSCRNRSLLCAGITTYSPMRHWGVTKGKRSVW